MTENQKEYRAAARERKRKSCQKEKELRKSLLSLGTHIFVLNRINRKIYKTSDCFKASVCWRSL